MSLRGKLGIFVLTAQEQRTIAFIVLALTLGLLTKHYRHDHTKAVSFPNDTKNSVPAHRGSPAPSAVPSQSIH